MTPAQVAEEALAALAGANVRRKRLDGQVYLAVYDVQVDEGALSYDFYLYGRLKYRMALMQVAHCLKTGEWPGHGEDSFDMELTYAAREEMNKLTGV